MNEDQLKKIQAHLIEALEFDAAEALVRVRVSELHQAALDFFSKTDKDMDFFPDYVNELESCMKDLQAAIDYYRSKRKDQVTKQGE